jgi:hypothetical protein
MCDLAKERQKIDAMLARAVGMDPLGGSMGRKELIEHSFTILREHYEHACSEKCMRERCEEFVERLLAGRRAQTAPSKGALPSLRPEARAA